ncbi:MAG: cytochrome-c oxidase, cbb3-type subunit III [Gammaproteobacteria bacterium]|jgi:cytochrome c oxidase cbb3-type subunit 3|nr:cytochrome-c oxidase, cbb3-type subunit III [Gammaproteobacteria bacterium]
MAMFESSFWTWWIGFFSVGGIIGVAALLYWQTVGEAKPTDKIETMGHTWDGDLAELNSPMPRWWLVMFYGLVAVALLYLLLYPGVGAFQGLLGWTHKTQYDGEVQAAEARYGPIYDRYAQQDLAALAKNPEAMQTGGRLFATYCTVCHGSDGRGAKGFPNLRDNDWLWGGEPQAIKTTILNGRQANMPGWEAMLGKEGVYNVVEYVRAVSGKQVDHTRADAGKAKYQQVCVACHGADAKGNPALGAPNLTDTIWLYGGTHEDLLHTVRHGRLGVMPAFKDFLGESRVHLLAAYVYSLSEGKTATKTP